jgi:hypothetical protein
LIPVRGFFRIFRLIGCLSAPAWICGCAGALFTSKPLPEMTSAALLQKINEHSGRLETFQGSGLFTMVSDQGSFRGGIRVITRSPDSLWLKLEGPLGIDLVTARMADGHFAFYSPWMTDSVLNSLDRKTFSRMLPIGLDSMDVLTGLLGLPRLNPGLLDSAGAVSMRKGHYVLNIGSSVSLWVEPRGPVISRWEKRDGEGKILWLYEAELFKSGHDVRLPKRIRFTESERRELILDYEDMKINQPLKRGWSDVRIPKGAKIQTL